MSKIKTVSLDEMFGMPPVEESSIEQKDLDIENEGRKTNTKLEVAIDDLVPFKNHPFKLYKGDRLNDMVESIKEHGVITPLIVRKLEDTENFEILSGHNRANAGKFAGLEKVPVVIKENLTDEEAMLIVTETNLIQRSFSELAHSEKARILAERHEAIKSQGKKMDIINEIEMLSNTDGLQEDSTSRQFGERLDSDVEIGKTYDLSPRNVSRYLRIDTLIKKIKDRIDTGEIPFTAGIDLSYLNEENQNTFILLIEEYNYKTDLKKASEIKKLNKQRNLTPDKMKSILSGEYFQKSKKTKKPKFTPKFTKNIAEKYVTEERSMQEIETIIQILLEDYFSSEDKEE